MALKFRQLVIRAGFNSKSRIRVYRKLIRFLDNSIPLIKALDILYYHATNDGRKPHSIQGEILNHWRRSVRGGKSFGQAIQNWVPESDRMVIEGGERAGALAPAINQAIEINKSMTQIKVSILSGLTYPFVLLTALVGFVVLFGLRVIPEFELVLPRAKWTGTGAQMAFLSDFAINWLVFLLPLLAISIILTLYSLPRWKGRIRAKFDNVPPWSLYRLLVGTGFILTIAGMIKSGVPIPRILAILQRDANPYYRERLHHTAQNVKNGHNLGNALFLTGFNFPDSETIKDIRIYADLNRFNEALETLGREWLEDSKVKIHRQSAIFRNVAIVALGTVFMWIASGIFDLQQQIAAAV